MDRCVNGRVRFSAGPARLNEDPANSNNSGTFNPATFFRCLGPEPYRAAYVEVSRRPSDGRYGENPNRTQAFHQYQVILKPCPFDVQQVYLESFRAIFERMTGSIWRSRRALRRGW